MDESNVGEDVVCTEDECDHSDDDSFEEHNTPLIDSNANQKSDPVSLSIGKIKILNPHRRSKSRFRKIIFYYIITIFLLLIIFNFLKNGFQKNESKTSIDKQSRCDRVSVTSVWNRTFPMLTIESAIRIVDVNNDSIPDLIIAFGTGADAAYYPSIVCRVYFNFTEESNYEGCGGGVMALEGRTGSLLWIRYTKHELFAVNCNHDLTDDTIPDCVVAGRMASLYAISGSNGDIIWSIEPRMGQPICETSNFYTPLYISKDVDGDSIPDILVMHGGDPLRTPTQKVRLPARLIFLSAKTGMILTWSVVPDGAESYYSPQELRDSNGRSRIVFGTGGETHRGSLFLISLDDLLSGEIRKAKILYSDCCKGVMAPPVLIDLNSDHILDIVIALFNSTVIAIDGNSLQVIWKSFFPGSETYSTPAVGYFNNDLIPDFMVIYQNGPGFPIYHFTEANILDGKNGVRLLQKPIKMLIGTQSSPLTISVDGGADIFLYWFSSCNMHNLEIDENTEPFRIMPGTNVHDASRADFCAIRFNTTSFTKLVAVSRNFEAVIYDSTVNVDIEKNRLNYTEIGRKWLQKHTESSNGEDYVYNQAYSQANNYPDASQMWSTKFSTYKRSLQKRHVGLHDADGVQRVISTVLRQTNTIKDYKQLPNIGTLVSSQTDNAVDIVFATYWISPSRNVFRMPTEMQKCVDRYSAPEVEANIRLLVPNSKLYGFDHDSYQEFVNSVCRQETKQSFVVSENKFYNPFSREMGSMTVYRKTLRCGQSVKGFEQQIWPSYLGRRANCIANTPDPPRVRGS